MLKRLSLVLFAGLLGLAGAPAAQAQHYRPFGPGRTYHYKYGTPTVADSSVYTFRVDSVWQSGPDSLFRFNYTMKYDQSTYSYSPQLWNLFGGQLRWRAATGVATMEATTAAGTAVAVQLLTRAAVGQSWLFAPGITATLRLRHAAVVLGQADTVQEIDLSDGRHLRLARRLGLVSGPSFDYYYWLGTPQPLPVPRPMLLAAVPELGVGTMSQRWQDVFGFAVGDQFFRRWYQWYPQGTWGASTTTTGWTRARVIARRAVGTALEYDLLETTQRTVYQNYGAGGPPPTTQNLFEPAVFRTQRFSLATTGDLLSFALDPTSTAQNCLVYPGKVHPDSLTGRLRTDAGFNSPSNYSQFQYAAGLGRVRSSVYNPGRQQERLVGYIKGAEVWGDTTRPRPLAVPATIGRLPASLAPNPAAPGAAPVLSLTLDQAQAVALTLYDALGRTVWQQTSTLAAGPQRLPVAAGVNKAPGLYRLRLTLADGRQTILPLVREQ